MLTFYHNPVNIKQPCKLNKLSQITSYFYILFLESSISLLIVYIVSEQAFMYEKSDL